MTVTLERPRRIADEAELAALLREYLDTWVTAGLRDRGVAADTGALLDATMSNLAAYLPPRGQTILAREPGGALAGTVFLKLHAHDTAEIKRLYVAPPGRGQGLGRRLASEAIAAARAAGSARVLIDTTAWMTGAQALYRSLGFREVPPYPESENDPAHFDHMVFMELTL